jgi:phosphoribosylanthranilate isomerase
MSFLTKLKLGNVTNLSDARYAAAVGIEYIGFCFDPASENYIVPIKAKEIIDWITGSNIVAEFGNQTFDEIKDISELLHVDVIELNNSLLPDELPGFGKPVIKKLDVGVFSEEQVQKELEAYQAYCDAFHLYATAQSRITHEKLVEICSAYNIIWGLPLQNQEVMNVIGHYKPFGINVSGGMEEKTGIKDFDELNELVDTLRTED